MASGIQETLKSVIGDGARNTRFDCIFEFPSSSLSSSDVAMMVKTSSFPYLEHQTVDLKFKGRSIPIRGQTKYSHTWECSFYMAEDHKLKKAFEAWIAALDEKVYYASSPSSAETSARSAHNSNGYTKDIVVYQLDYAAENKVVKYTLHNCFPISTSPIQLSMEGPGSVEELTVNFSYSYFETENMSTGSSSFADSIVSALTSSLTSSTNTSDLAFESSSQTMEELIKGINSNYDAGDLVSDLAESIISSVTSTVTSVVNSTVSSLKSSLLG